ncbi:M28 Zn-peptidase nicastrin, partial [Tanacetum coccineum]
MNKSMAIAATEGRMMIVIIIVIAAASCVVELCDASTVVKDVYRLIQYDISGSPFGSRLASINHHAASSSLLFGSSTDFSRAVLLLPLSELNTSFIQEYIEQGKPLGGLLLLLPQILRPEKSDDTVGGHDDISSDKENLKKQLVDLEQKLIHATINYPVYFAFEDEDLDKVLADIKRNDAAGQPATATTGG